MNTDSYVSYPTLINPKPHPAPFIKHLIPSLKTTGVLTPGKDHVPPSPIIIKERILHIPS